MYCRNCGYQINENDSFCTNCGAKNTSAQGQNNTYQNTVPKLPEISRESVKRARHSLRTNLGAPALAITVISGILSFAFIGFLVFGLIYGIFSPDSNLTVGSVILAILTVCVAVVAFILIKRLCGFIMNYGKNAEPNIPSIATTTQMDIKVSDFISKIKLSAISWIVIFVVVFLIMFITSLGMIGEMGASALIVILILPTFVAIMTAFGLAGVPQTLKSMFSGDDFIIIGGGLMAWMLFALFFYVFFIITDVKLIVLLVKNISYLANAIKPYNTSKRKP